MTRRRAAAYSVNRASLSTSAPAPAGPHGGGALLEEGVNSLAQVQVKQNESLDQALKRFKKQIQQSGVLKEAREHEHYEKPSDKRRKAAAARRRKAQSDLRKRMG